MPHPDLHALLQGFADPALCRALLQRLEEALLRYGRPLRFMEVCGTHTVSIFRSGLRSLLPAALTHISGPGCPVCVTHDREIAACLLLAKTPGARIATFGDLMRVPGPTGETLKNAQACGAKVHVLYSPMEALELARRYPRDKIVFLAAGFETTAPATAATVLLAAQEKLPNFYLLSLHKLVPPALRALLSSDSAAGGAAPPAIDAFLLPGHVSSIIGSKPYGFIADEFNKTAVIGGFEPSDILQSLLLILESILQGRPAIGNQYSRAVAEDGNPRAREIMLKVFVPQDALWRGLGTLPAGGLALREEYAAFDARRGFDLTLPEYPEIPGCKCGLVLRGELTPPQCPLFGKSCSPAHPVGPCMVSSEGSCAAHYKYNLG